MKKIFGFILFLSLFAFSADVKPFVFDGVAKDSAAQQDEYNYMLKYKLFGRDYITIGNDVVIQDQSGWNGTAGYMTANARLSLGGPVLVNETITFGDQPTLTSGPVRAQTYTYGNQNGACINGIVCLDDVSGSKVNHCETGMVYNSTSQICTDNVPASPKNLSIPTITWPDTITQSIIFDNQLNGDIKTIVVPDGKDQYDIYLDTIQFKLDHQKLQIEMQDGGRLTRIFVKHFLYHDHGQIQVVYRTDSTKYELSQKDYRGNVIIYTDESISIEHSDNSIMQGTMISTKEIYLACNINFAGQLLANQLRIGDTYNGENFRFVKFDPDTIDVKLDKYGGLRENDSTVVIPIELSDTTDINVYFTYCIDLKNGVTVDDFNIPPEFPICSNNESKKVSIPTGSKVPNIPIQVNVKIDTLTEPNDVLVLKITDISGAILPNGKTDGELKIKIIDAPNAHVTFDTTAVYKFEENKTGIVDLIKVLNATQTTRFVLDSAFKDRYTLDSITGELTLVNYPLNYELSAIDTIKVILKDTGDVSVTRNIPINVIDINEAPSINDTTITLQENIPIPSIVGTLIANDTDINSTFRQNVFELIEGNSNFTIDKNGRITASKIFNYETDSTEYKLKVKVYDKTEPSLYDSAIVTIKIGDTNEGPKFATEDTTLFVKENVKPSIIGTVTATDEDGDEITYKIVGNVPFTIDSKGNISSSREFDYEKETGFTFKVVATSKDDLTDTLKVTVKIVNENEPCDVRDTTFSINEGATGKIGNVNATDLDKDALFGTLTYSISDNTNYQIDKDGNVFVKVPFNYEDKTVDSIKVYVTDGTNKDSATIKINIKNVPEDITLTGSIKNIEENSEIGTPVGLINGLDGDSTDVSYSINVTEFKIDPITGVITTNSNLDYETQNEYPITVTVKSTDGSKKDTSFVIYVLNVNEPVHVNDTTLDVKENYTGPIGKIEGKDDDGESVKYNIRDSINYSIDSLGVITVKKPFDYETKQFDTLIVDVTTDSGDKDSAKVIINVKNVNENPVLLPNDSLTVPENCKNCIVGIITAKDPDNDPIKYVVKEPGFTIDSNGVLKLTNPLDYEKTPNVTVTIIATDPSGAGDTATYKIKVTDINEPVHTKDTTCTVKENYTGNVCKIPGTDEDGKKPTWIVSDTINYKIDTTGQLIIKNPLDYETKTKDTVKVIVTDGEFYDTATVIINVIDEDEKPSITEVDDKPKVDTLKTNNPDHKIDFKICEGNKCYIDSLDVTVKKDTTIKVCNVKKTVCDSVVILFNDAPPVVTLTNAKSTSAKIDYITIEEQKDNKIYVNKKTNQITVTVKDTTHKTEKHFDIEVKLDTLPTKDINLTDYNYLIDDTKSTITPIGNNKAEMVETVKDNGVVITISQIIDLKTRQPIDTVQTVTYTKKVNGKDVVITYKTDNITGKRISDYNVSYMVDSCTKVTYTMNDKKQIVKNEEDNIAYTVSYDYIDDFGNKASASVEIVYDDIPPVVEILEPIAHSVHKKNAIEVKWTVNGEIQDTLTLQRLEKGPNTIIRRYVDKAGNECSDTILVIMKEAKDIDIHIINPVTEINQDKVNEYYGNGNKYNSEKPFRMITVDPKTDTLPETVGIGFVVDIALPTVSPTGSLATLDDLIKNGQIPVDDKGNIVGASTKGIPVEEYVENHCTEEFKQDYRKNGANIPLYDVKYKLNLWIYTSNAGYVNDFTIDYTLNDESLASEAGTVKMVIDWLADTDGEVKASNHKALGSEAYITKLYSTSVAKHRCDFKDQLKGQKTIKKDETMKTFGYKRPKNK